MTAARAALLWGLVAGQAARRGGQVAAADVCAAVVEALPVSGAWVMAQGTAGAGHLMCVTDEVGEQLAELQMTLGEGPCLDVLTSGAPVLVSDLDEGCRPPLAGLHAAGLPGRRCGDLRAPVADRGHPGRFAWPVPG